MNSKNPEGASPRLRFALRAAFRTVRQPGSLGNPLLFWGGEQSGKSFILKKIQRRASRRGRSVFLSSVERFSLSFRKAVQQKTVNNWTQEILASDFFLLDGIEKLEGSRHTQAFILSFWDRYILSSRQVVLASRVRPSEISKLDPRLASRFESGFLLDLGAAKPQRSLATLAESVAKRFDVPVETLLNSSAHRAVFARAAFVSLAIEQRFETAEISSLLGSKSKASLHYVQKKSEDLLQKDPEYRTAFEELSFHLK